MTDRKTHCLYLSAPSDDLNPPWCGLGLDFPASCKECESYEEAWAPPDQYEKQAWRLVPQ